MCLFSLGEREKDQPHDILDEHWDGFFGHFNEIELLKPDSLAFWKSRNGLLKKLDLLFIYWVKGSGFFASERGSAPRKKFQSKVQPLRPFWNGRFGSESRIRPFRVPNHPHYCHHLWSVPLWNGFAMRYPKEILRLTDCCRLRWAKTNTILHGLTVEPNRDENYLCR